MFGRELQGGKGTATSRIEKEKVWVCGLRRCLDGDGDLGEELNATGSIGLELKILVFLNFKMVDLMSDADDKIRGFVLTGGSNHLFLSTATS